MVLDVISDGFLCISAVCIIKNHKGPKFGQKWANFELLRIFQTCRIWFFKENYMTYKKLAIFIAAFGSYMSKTLKTVNFCQKMAKFSS